MSTGVGSLVEDDSNFLACPVQHSSSLQELLEWTNWFQAGIATNHILLLVF